MKLKNSIKEIRQERKLSLRALEKKSKVSKSELSNIETGFVNDILLSTAYKIANALNVKIDELFYYEN